MEDLKKGWRPRALMKKDSTDASPLVEHPVYFVSTVPREARA